jgi:hypothetical protein
MKASTHFDEQRHRLVQESEGLGLEVEQALDVLDATTRQTRTVFEMREMTARELLELLHHRRSEPKYGHTLHALVHHEFPFQWHMQYNVRQTVSNAGGDTVALVQEAVHAYRSAMHTYGKDSDVAPPIHIGFSVPTYRARASTTKTGNVGGFCVSIRKNDYYKGVLSSINSGGGSTGATATYTFTPLGS